MWWLGRETCGEYLLLFRRADLKYFTPIKIFEWVVLVVLPLGVAAVLLSRAEGWL